MLDAGCGPGLVALRIARQRPDLAVHGVDLAAGMISEATHLASADGLGQASFTHADLADMPFADDTFDLIVSSASLHHWADVPAVVRELSRVLRPGGRLRVYDARFVDSEPFVAAAASAFPGRPVRTLMRRRRLSVPLIQLLGVDA